MIRALAIALAAALAACSTDARAPAPPAPAKPALWKVVDPDTTIYLFGTIHALPQGTVWQSAALKDALAKSQGLVLEVGNLDDPQAMAAAFNARAASPGLPPILDRVPPEKRATLQKALADAGFPLDTANRLETWAVALQLTVASLGRAGIGRDEGVEAKVREAFSTRKLPISGLETADLQFGLFDGLSEPSQRLLLEASIEDDKDIAREFARMVAAWRTGDLKGVADSFDEEMRASPELAQTLLYRRNANWAAWVKQRMAQPGTIFVAVGAGHLAGNGSVEDLVAKAGLKVVRVQ